MPSRVVAPVRDTDAGFTLVEMVIALTLMAMVMSGAGIVLFGSMRALTSARERSTFVEIATAEMDALRAVPYNLQGVASTDASYSAAYPSALFDSHDRVTACTPPVTPDPTCPALPLAPAAVTTVTTSPVTGIILPYTIRRWVTWTDAAGGTTHVFKRLTVQVEWTERNLPTRTFRLSSVIYPGGLGSAGANHVPVVTATGAPTAIAPGATVTFVGAATDADGDTLTYSWNFGDGSAASTVQSPTHVYSSAGTYTATLSVSDGHSGTGTSAVAIAVNGTGGTAPVASFAPDPTSGAAPLAVDVDGSASTNTVGWTWSWGDATPDGTGVATTHTYTVAGAYTITLTVRSPTGVTATKTATVTATGSSTPPCVITLASFKNPGTNTVANFVSVHNGNHNINNGNFVFSATSNLACTGVTTAFNGTNITLVLQSTGATKTWSATTTLSGSMSTGCTQAGSFSGTNGTTPITFPYTYGVATGTCP